MKKIAVLVAVALLLVGFVYYILFLSPARDISEKVTENTQNIENVSVPEEKVIVPEQGKGTLSFLMSVGVPMECTIKQDASAGVPAVEGTYFVSKNNVRADFLTSDPEVSESVLSSMILSDDFLYIWSKIEGEYYGVKMPKSDLNKAENQSKTPVAFDDEINYQCKPWLITDDSVFLPPAEVNFSDISKLMQAGMEYGTISGSDVGIEE